MSLTVGSARLTNVFRWRWQVQNNELCFAGPLDDNFIELDGSVHSPDIVRVGFLKSVGRLVTLAGRAGCGRRRRALVIRLLGHRRARRRDLHRHRWHDHVVLGRRVRVAGRFGCFARFLGRLDFHFLQGLRFGFRFACFVGESHFSVSARIHHSLHLSTSTTLDESSGS